MRKFTPVERRIGAILLLLLALLLAYLLLVHWWFVAPWLGMREQMQSLRADQHRYAAIVAERQSLHARLRELARRRSGTDALVAGGDSNAATANLMQQVVDTVAGQTAAGPCKVTQKMPLPARSPEAGAAAAFEQVSASISLRCGMRALAGALQGLATHKPYVFIDDFSVYRDASSGRNGVALPLHVKMTVSAYRPISARSGQP